LLCRKHYDRGCHCERKKPLALSEQKLALSVAEWVEGEAISNTTMAFLFANQEIATAFFKGLAMTIVALLHLVNEY